MASESAIPITKDMTFGEVMKKYPETAGVFFNYQLRCIGCPISAMETIEHGARAHNIKLVKLLADLNKASAIRR
jgi:hybrid cluster-associated redox disulfide protein